MTVLDRRADTVTLAYCQGPYGLPELTPTVRTPAERRKSQDLMLFFHFLQRADLLPKRCGKHMTTFITSSSDLI